MASQRGAHEIDADAVARRALGGPTPPEGESLRPCLAPAQPVAQAFDDWVRRLPDWLDPALVDDEHLKHLLLRGDIQSKAQFDYEREVAAGRRRRSYHGRSEFEIEQERRAAERRQRAEESRKYW